MAKGDTGINIARAFVEIVPSTKGVGKAICDAFNNANNSVSQKGSESGKKYAVGFNQNVSKIGSNIAQKLTSANSTVIQKGSQAGTGYASTFSQKAAGIGGKIQQALNSMASHAQKSGENAGSGFAKGFGLKMGMISGIAQSVTSKIIGAFGGITSEIMSASDSAQKFGATLQFAGVSNKQIKELTKSTQTYADKTVYDLEDIRSTTAQLASNGVKGYDKLAEAAGNLNAIAGGNKETFKSVAMVLTQTAGAGKLTADNWRQLSQAIPGASGKIQEQLKKNGVYTGNFADAMRQGKITSEAFNQALLDLGFNDVAVKAAQSTVTIEGAWGNLQASVVKAGMVIFDSIKGPTTQAMSAIADAISDLTNSIQAPLSAAISGAIDWFGKLFAAMQNVGVFESFKAIWQSLCDIFKEVFSIVGGWGALFPPESLSAALKGVLDALNGALQVVKFLTPALSPLIAAWAGYAIAVKAAQIATSGWSSVTKIATAAQAAFNVVMSMNPIGAVVLALAALTGILVWFFTQTETGKKVWQALCEGFSQFIGGIGPALGIMWNGIISGFQGFINICSNVCKAVQGVIQSIVGTLSPIISTVLGAIGAAFGQLAQIIGSAFAALPALFSQLGEALQGLWNTISSIVEPLFEQLAKIIGPTFSEFPALFSQLGEALQDLWNIFSTVLGAIGAAFGQLAQIIESAFGQLAQIIGSAFAALPVLFSKLGAILQGVWNIVSNVAKALSIALLQPIQAVWNFLQTVFSAVGQAIQLVWQALQPLINAIGTLIPTAINIMAPLLQGAFSIICTVFQTLGNIIAAVLIPAFNAIIPIVCAVAQTVGGVLLAAFQAIVGVIQGVIQVFTGIIQFIAGVFIGNWNKCWQGIQNIFGSIWTAIKSIVTGVWNAISSLIQGGLQVIQTVWNTVWNAIKGIGEAIWNGIKAIIQTTLNTISNVWNACWNGVKSYFGTIWDGIKNGAKAGIDAVFRFVTGLKDRILGFFSNAGQWLLNAGRAILDGLLAGLRHAWQSVCNFVGGIGSWIAKHKGPISYDKKLLIPAGNAIMQGFSKGLGNSWQDVQKQVAGFTKQSGNWFNDSNAIRLKTTVAPPDGGWNAQQNQIAKVAANYEVDASRTGLTKQDLYDAFDGVMSQGVALKLNGRGGEVMAGILAKPMNNELNKMATLGR